MAKAVLVRDRALAHIGDDLHVLMGMRREARVGSDLVVVPHAQGSVPQAVWVVIAGEGEMMLRLEPAMVGAAEVAERSPVDHYKVLHDRVETRELGAVSAVDIQGRTGDIRGRRAGEKCNRR